MKHVHGRRRFLKLAGAGAIVSSLAEEILEAPKSPATFEFRFEPCNLSK